MKKKIVKKKSAGRPIGSPDRKSEYLRDQEIKFRCSQGFNKVVEEIMKTGAYKSKADVLHEALAQLAYKKLPADNYWINKIQ